MGSSSGELWGSERDDAPVPLRTLLLPDPVAAGATLALDRQGRLWIGGPGELLALDADDARPLVRASVEPRVPARVLGTWADRNYVRADGDLFTLDSEGSVRARRSGLGGSVVAVDPLGRHLYVATDAGAVLGLDPRLLRPLWAWPRLGRPATAAASSPEGDRLYLALGPAAEPSEPTLQVRDVQTGRVLAETRLPAPVWELAVGATGTVFAATGTGETSELVALRPLPAGLEPVWRQSLALQGVVRIRSAGRRLVAFTPAGALHLLDAASGQPIGTADAPLDVAAGDDGVLYLLYPQQILVLR